jgi:DNA repair protein RadC
LLTVIGAGQREFLAITFHDSHGRFLGQADFAGGEAFLKVRYRMLIEHALAHRADKILLMHNHPSGDPRPSGSDLASTAALMSLCRPLDIEVVDHLIVGGRRVVSMRKAGLLRSTLSATIVEKVSR